MPELPEVEVVRAGLERWVTGALVDDVEVLHPRAIRRHVPGAADLTKRLRGRRLGAAERRGKFLWIPLDAGEDEALVAHLGMSGQLLVHDAPAPDERHLRVRLRLREADVSELRFVDQRTFGGLAVDALVAGRPARPGSPGRVVPEPVAHIAPDLLEDDLDLDGLVREVRRRNSEIKRVLLDQTVVSGIGNIYADEALWRARLSGLRRAAALPRTAVLSVLDAAAEVMREALRAGGTSFDALYVNVNGQSGYFERGLAAYGREGQPCLRCGTPIRRAAFANRSSFSCPVCQPPPRRSRGPR
ncbi:MAG: bifunctional DNA-formamidopyrimidine glycosylase/DNA-(apurinic or apyrimidinic site) lyase [Actinomycetales bacterium]